MMEDVIARINELAKKAKAEGLTPAERSERDGLRRIYLDAMPGKFDGSAGEHLCGGCARKPAQATKKGPEPQEES